MSQLAHWLDANLLSLNVKKTNFLAFHITRATEPELSHLTIRNPSHAHRRGPMSEPSSCTISRMHTTKYLGIILDENLSFEEHIKTLSKRVRKQIYVMKILRPVASLEVRRLVYTSLCQSLLQYCIGVWGGAAKSHMIKLERAQRGVLKVMFGKPRRYSTDKLFEEAAILTVRQLFVMRAVAIRLTTSPHQQSSDEEACPASQTQPKPRTVFARRLPKHVHINTYNEICKSLDLQGGTSREVKSKLKRWLLSLNYEDTERLVKQKVILRPSQKAIFTERRPENPTISTV